MCNSAISTPAAQEIPQHENLFEALLFISALFASFYLAQARVNHKSTEPWPRTAAGADRLCS